MESRKSNRTVIILLSVFMSVLILLAAATVVVVSLEVMPKNTSDPSSAEKGSQQSPIDSGTSSFEKKLKTVRDMLDTYYLFDEEDIDFESEMIKAYVDALGDPYTVYYTPEEFDELMQSNSGTYSGIGAVLQQDPKTNVITIIRPFKGSPAEEAGLKTGDIILSVGETTLTDEDINLVVTWIRGDKGTTVDLKIYRPSETRSFDVTVQRDEIEEETVTYEMLPDDIGYIMLSSFTEVTYDQFMEAFNDLKSQRMKALIIDLRDNGGGLLSSVNSIVDKLIPAGIITYTIDKNDRREEYRSYTKSELDVPTVVLCNEYSASASEIFIGAVQSYGVATIIGTQTFGKGIVQTIQMLPDGSGMKITFSRYYTPSDVCIHEIGITPDHVVEYDYDTEVDDQLEYAISYLKNELP